MYDFKPKTEELFEVRFAEKPLLRLPDINNRTLHPTIGELQRRRRLSEAKAELAESGVELASKTQNFEERTQDIAGKALAIKEWLIKHEGSLRKNEAIKMKALRRAAKEKRKILESEASLQRLQFAVELLEKLERKLEARIEAGRTYETFLQSVVSFEEADFAAYGFGKPRDVMNRYDSLVRSKADLTRDVTGTRKAIDGVRAETDAYSEAMQIELQVESKRLAELRVKHDDAYVRASELRSAVTEMEDSASENSKLFTKLNMAIANVYEVAKTKMPAKVKTLYDDKEFKETLFVPSTDVGDPLEKLSTILCVLQDSKFLLSELVYEESVPTSY